jgi:glycosyltransferase involved in cell wall biosynthesis
MRFSVIIPSYQSHKTILKCLDGLLAQRYHDFEAIFVDSSPDSRVKEAIENHSVFRVIHLPEKTLSEVARNLAADEARGDILVFLDSDCIPEKEWLQQAAAVFHDGAQVICGPVLCHGDRLIDLTAHLAKFWLWLPDKDKKQAKTAPTANLAIQRALFWEMGGLNPGYLSSADAGLCLKLADSGIEVQFINSFMVEHIHDTTFRTLCRERFIRGREFGVMRTQLAGWTRMKSFIFILSIPVLPVKNFLLKWATVSRSGYCLPFLKGVFAHLLLEHAWMYGQFGSHVHSIFRSRSVV